LEALEIKTMI